MTQCKKGAVISVDSSKKGTVGNKVPVISIDSNGQINNFACYVLPNGSNQNVSRICIAKKINQKVLFQYPMELLLVFPLLVTLKCLLLSQNCHHKGIQPLNHQNSPYTFRFSTTLAEQIRLCLNMKIELGSIEKEAIQEEISNFLSTPTTMLFSAAMENGMGMPLIIFVFQPHLPSRSVFV